MLIFQDIENPPGDNKVTGGQFICARPGLYKFQVYSLSRSDANLYLELYQNGDLVASLWAHTHNDYAAAGNAVILNLNEGDTVQVKTRSQNAVDLYGTAGQVYTTFSGVQLKSTGRGKRTFH